MICKLSFSENLYDAVTEIWLFIGTYFSFVFIALINEHVKTAMQVWISSQKML